MEWISLITGILGPLLLKCLGKTSAEDPRAFLTSHYDASTDSFSGNVVQDALPQTYRAIRMARRRTAPKDRKNFPRYSRDEVVSMTKDHLKKSMNATDDQLTACKAMADQLPDDDDES